MASIEEAIKSLNGLIDGLQGKEFQRTLKSEVDKANKRLKRMNDFQKSVFESKGITEKISRAGSFEDKLNALAKAKMINDSGISTKTEYKHYINKMSNELSLSKKEVDYMLNHFDSTQLNFMSNTPLKYGSNPQIDFLYEDVVELNEGIENKINDISDYITSLLDLSNEIIDITL